MRGNLNKQFIALTLLTFLLMAISIPVMATGSDEGAGSASDAYAPSDPANVAADNSTVVDPANLSFDNVSGVPAGEPADPANATDVGPVYKNDTGDGIYYANEAAAAPTCAGSATVKDTTDKPSVTPTPAPSNKDKGQACTTPANMTTSRQCPSGAKPTCQAVKQAKAMCTKAVKTQTNCAKAK